MTRHQQQYTGVICLLVWLAAALLHFLPIDHDYLILQMIGVFLLTCLGMVYLLKYIYFIARFDKERHHE